MKVKISMKGAKPDPKPDTTTDDKLDAKLDDKTDDKTDAKPDAKPDAKSNAKPDAKKGVKKGVKSDAKSRTKQGANSGGKQVTQTILSQTVVVKSSQQPLKLGPCGRNCALIGREHFGPIGHVQENMEVTDDVRNFWPPVAVPSVVATMLTKPVMHFLKDLPDTLKDIHCKGSTDPRRANDRLLMKLIAGGNLRKALNLIGKILSVYGHGFGNSGPGAIHTPYTMRLWLTRLQLLIRLKEFEILQVEAERFDQLRRPDTYYEYYPKMFKDKKGSIGCFCFRLFLAHLPVHFNLPDVAIKRLIDLVKVCTDNQKHFHLIGNRFGVVFWYKRQIRAVYALTHISIVCRKFDTMDKMICNMIAGNYMIDEAERMTWFSNWNKIYKNIISETYQTK